MGVQGPKFGSVLLLALFGAGVVTSVCCSTGPSNNNNWPPDGTVPPDAQPDARPDAWVEPVVAVVIPEEVGHTEPCDATHLILGPDGSYVTMQQSFQNGFVTYGVSQGGQPGDVFLYDLETCTEYLLTPQNELEDANPSLWNGRIVYSAGLPAEDWVASGGQLMEIDLETLDLRQLSPWAQGRRPRQNGRRVLFRRYECDPVSGECSGLYDLVLHDRWMDQQTVMAEDWAESHRINEEYAVWIGSGGSGGSVFYAELATGDVVEVASTRDHAIYDTDLWGDIVLWTDLRTGLGAIHGLRISSGEEFQLTDDSDVHSLPVIQGHLAAWRTRPNTGEGYQIEVHDLETGVRRTVVAERSWNWKTVALDGEWLIYLEETGGYWYNTIHAVNLQRLGLLGPDGHLLP